MFGNVDRWGVGVSRRWRAGEGAGEAVEWRRKGPERVNQNAMLMASITDSGPIAAPRRQPVIANRFEQV